MGGKRREERKEKRKWEHWARRLKGETGSSEEKKQNEIFGARKVKTFIMRYAEGTNHISEHRVFILGQ